MIFNCFEVFPVFDQPDLKAPMKLTVLTHENWIAIGNSPEKRYNFESEEGEQLIADCSWMVPFFLTKKEVVTEEEEKKEVEVLCKLSVVEFQKTMKISTYLYALVAGAYII